jgi:hypothetical protein
VGRPTDEDRLISCRFCASDALAESSGYVGVSGAVAPRLQHQLAGIAASVNTRYQQEAREDVRRGIDLWRGVHSRFWASEEDRQLYTRDYLVALEVAAGRARPTVDQLYFLLLSFEKRYQAHELETLKQAERQRALWAVRAHAAKNPMNPPLNFEEGRIQVLLTTARRDTRWVENNIQDAMARIDPITKAQFLVVTYDDGATLEIPLHPEPAMFRQAVPESDAIRVFFRRHKGSGGRLVPFHMSYTDFSRLASDHVPVDETLSAVPPRFDPVLTPRILNLRDLVNSRRLLVQFGALTEAYLTVTAATGVAGLGRSLAEGTAVTTAAATTTVVQTGRAALSNIQFAVGKYGYSKIAVAYLGRTAWVFYLKHAVAVNTAVIFATELLLSLHGADMGPVGSGDALTFAVRIEKTGWRVLKTRVTEVEKDFQVARVTLTGVEEITAKKADEVFDSGRLIYHEKAVPAISKSPNPRATDDPKVATRDTGDTGTADAAKATTTDASAKQSKGKRIVVSPDPKAGSGTKAPRPVMLTLQSSDGQLTNDGVQWLRNNIKDEIADPFNARRKLRISDLDDDRLRAVYANSPGLFERVFLAEIESSWRGRAARATDFLYSSPNGSLAGFARRLEPAARAAKLVVDRSVLNRRMIDLFEDHPNLQQWYREANEYLARRIARLEKDLAVSRGEQAVNLRKELTWVRKDVADLRRLAQGKIGSKKPDAVEVLLGQNEVYVWDATLAIDNPVHRFKTHFYGQVIEDLLRGQVNVTAADYRAAMKQRPTP